MNTRCKNLIRLFETVALGACLVVAAGCTAERDSQDSDSPNVVLLVVDALRPDHVGCYGYDVPTSPNIDAVAADGVVFETAVSHAPWTKSAFSSMLTSLYPFQHGVLSWTAVMPDTIETLPQVLKRGGYATGCVMNTVALSGRYRILKGFDHVHVVEKEDRDAFKTSEDAIEFIKEASEPFMVMVHYSDVHSPYRPPVKYVDAIRGDSELDPLSLTVGGDELDEGGEDPEYIAKIKMLYDGCVRLADDGLGEMIRYLRDGGMLNRTVVIITADHGEGFWEHGRAFHAGSVYEEVIRVPLIMAYPEMFGRGIRVRTQVRHVDILPTIMNLTGVTDLRHREGMSLVELVQTGKRSARGSAFLPPEISLCECTTPRAPALRCLRLDGWKLVVESITATSELYDLGADPGETVNLAGQGQAIEDSLLEMIQGVSGIRLGGWRLSFAGADTDSPFEVTVRLDKGRFSHAQRFARSQADKQVAMNADSTAFSFTARGKDLNPILFDTRPRNAGLEIAITGGGGAEKAPVWVGPSQRFTAGEVLRSTPGEALGLPQTYVGPREPAAPAAFVWWLPGEAVGAGQEASKLSPEQTKRLKALGYIQ